MRPLPRLRDLIGAAVLCASAVTPAAAQDDSCAAVVQAMQAMSAAPRMHWKMSATTPARRRPFEREQIVVDDIVYLTPDEGRWMKQRITSAERVARLKEELARNPISECRAADTDDAGGVPTSVYTYRQGDAAGGGSAAEKRIWIGTADGLPRRFQALEGPVSVRMQVDYDHVETPLP